MNIPPLLAFGAVAIGVALGLLGGGGSILTIPMFVYAAGLDPKIAVAASLPVVGLTSAAGALAHWHRGHVRVRTAVLFGMGSVAGAFVGARLAVHVPGTVQLVLLAFVMLAAALRMFAGAADSTREAPADERFPFMTLVPLAFSIGVLTGVIGIGGGFLIVPALVLVVHLPMRIAVGTSLIVIALTAASGAVGNVGHVTIPWGLVVPFTAIAVVSSLLASRFGARIPQTQLRRAFAVLLLVTSTLMLIQKGHVFTGRL